MSNVQFPSQKQIDLAVKLAPQLSAIGITQEEVLSDSWRYQAIGRVAEPKGEVLVAIKELKGRPVYKRSSREAQMQLVALRALSALLTGKTDEATELLRKEFMQREKAVS